MDVISSAEASHLFTQQNDIQLDLMAVFTSYDPGKFGVGLHQSYMPASFTHQVLKLNKVNDKNNEYTRVLDKHNRGPRHNV